MRIGCLCELANGADGMRLPTRWQVMPPTRNPEWHDSEEPADVGSTIYAHFFHTCPFGHQAVLAHGSGSSLRTASTGHR